LVAEILVGVVMRRLLLSGLLSMLGLSALAAEPDEPDHAWAKRPVAQDYSRAFPNAARKAKVNGQTIIGCTIVADGALSACKVLKEEPAGYGFGEAALGLTPKYRLSPEVAGAKAGTGLALPIYFKENGFTTQTAGGEVRELDWRRKPSAAELRAAWPVAALRRGVGGKAVIGCQVTTIGLLEKCKVVSEEPADMGFGAAGLLLSSAFEMQPRLENGKPTVTTVQIPIMFRNYGTSQASVDPGQVFRGIHRPIWDAAPSAADLAAAWPSAAPKELESARATLTCRVKPDGGLRECREVSIEPDGGGFRGAAFKLVPKFRLRISGVDPATIKTLGVSLPIQFLNPAMPRGERQLSNAQWTRMPDTKQVLEVFPADAAAKGVKVGLGVAECRVGAGGALADCKPARAQPDGLGFAEAAVTIARVMAVNLWGEDGLPPDGAVLRLPIRFNLNEPAAKEGS
jgi:hypothetical protein